MKKFLEKFGLVSKIDLGLFFLVSIVLFAVPVIFVPVFGDWFDFPKQTILLWGALLGLALVIVRSALEKKVIIFRSYLDLPIFIFALISVISAILTENKIVSLSLDPALYLGCALFFFVLLQVVNSEKMLSFFLRVFLFSGLIVAVLTLVQFVVRLIIPLKIASINAIVGNFILFNPTFSLTGSLLSTAMFLTICLCVAVGLFFELKPKGGKIFYEKILVVALAAGLIAAVYGLFQNKPLQLPLDVSWKVATSTLGQSFRSAVFGGGPGSFVDLFTAFKGFDFNSNPYWNLRFVVAGNYYFHLLATLGIAGLTAFVFLVLKFLKQARVRMETGLTAGIEKGLIGSAVVTVFVLIIFPAPTIVIVSFYVILGLLMGFYRVTENQKNVWQETRLESLTIWSKWAVAAIAFVCLVFSVWHFGRFALADYYFAKSIQAASRNQGAETYNFQIKAVEFNPWNDGYRISYSQTNLALADALASQKNLTDQQKQTVVTLVQQAIREARNAAALAPKRAANWENLSLIYRNLINFASGADQFAIASAVQATSFDPSNPRLRLDLGGIYFSLKDYQAALQAFSQAINLKNDYANAHYNTAQAYKQLNQKDLALSQLQMTASLICADSENSDCKKVNSEIAELGGTTATSSAKTGEDQTPISTSSAKSSNLPKVKTTPPALLATPSGEIAQ